MQKIETNWSDLIVQKMRSSLHENFPTGRLLNISWSTFLNNTKFLDRGDFGALNLKKAPPGRDWKAAESRQQKGEDIRLSFDDAVN